MPALYLFRSFTYFCQAWGSPPPADAIGRYSTRSRHVAGILLPAVPLPCEVSNAWHLFLRPA